MPNETPEQALGRELAEVRDGHRQFKLALLKALGVTDPWAITVWKQKHYEEAIERLRSAKTPS